MDAIVEIGHVVSRRAIATGGSGMFTDDERYEQLVWDHEEKVSAELARLNTKLSMVVKVSTRERWIEPIQGIGVVVIVTELQIGAPGL